MTGFSIEVVDLSEVRVRVLRLGARGLPYLLGIQLETLGEMPELWASFEGKMKIELPRRPRHPVLIR